MSSTPALDKFNEEMRKWYGITPEQSLQEMERLRSRTRHNEASALYNAEQRGRAIADAKWQEAVADKDTKSKCAYLLLSSFLIYKQTKYVILYL